MAVNHAERRRAEAIERRRHAGLKAFHRATGGAIELHLVRAEMAPELFVGSNRLATAFRGGVARFYSLLAAQQCVLCGDGFDPFLPVDWAVVMPLGIQSARDALISGICLGCSRGEADDRKMILAVHDVLRRLMWPGLREINQDALVDTARA